MESETIDCPCCDGQGFIPCEEGAIFAITRLVKSIDAISEGVGQIESLQDAKIYAERASSWLSRMIRSIKEDEAKDEIEDWS